MGIVDEMVDLVDLPASMDRTGGDSPKRRHSGSVGGRNYGSTRKRYRRGGSGTSQPPSSPMPGAGNANRQRGPLPKEFVWQPRSPIGSPCASPSHMSSASSNTSLSDLNDNFADSDNPSDSGSESGKLSIELAASRAWCTVDFLLFLCSP